MSDGMLEALLRTAREARRWSQGDLARTAGVPAATIARLERGDASPQDRQQLARLARALGLPPAALRASVARRGGTRPAGAPRS